MITHIDSHPRMKILKLLICFVSGHDWTTPFLERKCEIDHKAIGLIGVAKAFKIDNEMYCKRCGKESHLNVNL